MAYVQRVAIIAASLAIFFFFICSFAEKAYPSYAKDATSAAATEFYDYIVIGGGAAGCALAATLSTSAKVVVLERGGLPYNNPKVTHIKAFLPTLLDPTPSSPAQQFFSTDGVLNHRARILGGGTAINAGFYSKASKEYVQGVGWDPRLVNESYEWVERKLVFRPQVMSWQAAVRDGLLEEGVLPDNGFTYEHLQGTKIGGTIFDENGYRHTAADLLEYADPTMITVYLYASVHQILFKTLPGQKRQAYGVMFKDSKGIIHTSLLNNNTKSEIILSAGAVGSPQLLMLSGIGPAHHLNTHGINVILDQPMVGQGMSDNPLNAVLIPSPRPVENSLAEAVGILDEDDIGCYIEAASGLLGLNILPIINITQFGIIGEKLARPYSTGYLELQSNDPDKNPKVTFNYFKDPRDLQKCVQNMEIVKRVVESKAFSEFRYPFASFESLLRLTLAIPTNPRIRHVITGALSLEKFCLDTVLTQWRGCQVGRVVDTDYRVMDVDSLRVIDASTFYTSPGTNPQATVMMLGRHTVADLFEYANPTMITVYLHATVHQVLFKTLPGQKPKAYGIAFRDSKGCNHIALLKTHSTSEIILSAGALGSPQLLMLRGIGPAHHLKAHGIDVILDQPMVGQGMSDNPMNQVRVPSPMPVESSLGKLVGIRDDIGCYIEGGSGSAISPSTNHFASFESLLELMLWNVSSNLRKRGAFVGGALLMEQFCVDTVMTIWHYHGGCQVGRVVDTDYRVMGVESLRVIDASTFYDSPGTNPQATIMKLGRYMGKKILQQKN